MTRLLGRQPIAGLDEYLTLSDGPAIDRFDDLGADEVIAQIRAAGLRGRGGAGFPTGIKWRGLADDSAVRKFVVCNAAEGEPGTFKDRTLLRRNPYQVLEGVAVAAWATGAREAYIGIKERFSFEMGRLEVAAEEMVKAGLLGDIELTLVPGPDDYLFGEEKAMLEVIEGRDALPRLQPPYSRGLFEEPNGPTQPALVNNVETLANVPHILRHGPDWFRSMGTERSPGTVLVTLSGDVNVEVVTEVEMGTTLRRLIDDFGGGTRTGAPVLAVLNGVSNAPLTADQLDTPIAYETLEAAGSGLGSASFMVFDASACPVQIAAAASSFLARGSCGQCTPCKLGTTAIRDSFAALLPSGGAADIERIAAWTMRVTDANRCGLGGGQRAVSKGFLERFPDHLAQHIDGTTCGLDRTVRIDTIDDWDAQTGRFTASPRGAGAVPDEP